MRCATPPPSLPQQSSGPPAGPRAVPSPAGRAPPPKPPLPHPGAGKAPTAPTCPPPPGRSAQRGKVSRPAPPPPQSRPPPPPGAPASWSAWPGRARRTEPPARAEEGTAQEEGRGSGGRGGSSSSSNEGVRGTPRPPRAAARARPGTPPPGRARTCGPAEPRRAPPAPPPPSPPGSGLREGGVPRRGRGRRGQSSSGWGQGPARTPRLCTCSTSPPQRSVLPGPGRPPPVGRHRPPALLQPGRARRAARGGARGPPSLGPRRSWPRCPHFLPLPAGRAAWDGPGAPGSPELRARLTPLSWQPLARSFRGRTMGYIARLRTESAWPARRGYPREEAEGQPGGTLAGVTTERPTQADPGPLPSRASPAPLSALSLRKQRLIRYPRPASQRRGNGRVAEGNRGGQRSGGARTATEGAVAQPSPITQRRHFEKSPRAIFQPRGKA
ncbi:uncharacterized protein LOC125960883 [Orcinus orca]|uniref:uncharacterized protein LOC125960883 n=1 Tax=Orcinus orca TaxID=9733 RepID=UPI002112A605|nr:uncharacterized protein LOC125960883 [Orcinus orca]